MSVALITGCSSGFGMAAALELAKRGETVVATMRDVGKSEPLKSAAAGLILDVLQLDVTDPGSRDSAIAGVLARHGQIDVLINNAGICSVGASEVLGETDIMVQFETNVFSAHALIMAVLPGMRASRSGRIVNVTSVASFFAPPFMTGYAATKHALDAISVGLDLELKDFNIRVTSVAPSAFGTGIGANTVHPAADTPYGEAPIERYNSWTETMKERNDISSVLEAIIEAATTPNPKLRYVVTPTTPPFAAIAEEKQRFDEARRATG